MPAPTRPLQSLRYDSGSRPGPSGDGTTADSVTFRPTASQSRLTTTPQTSGPTGTTPGNSQPVGAVIQGKTSNLGRRAPMRPRRQLVPLALSPPGHSSRESSDTRCVCGSPVPMPSVGGDLGALEGDATLPASRGRSRTTAVFRLQHSRPPSGSPRGARRSPRSAGISSISLRSPLTGRSSADGH